MSSEQETRSGTTLTPMRVLKAVVLVVGVTGTAWLAAANSAVVVSSFSEIRHLEWNWVALAVATTFTSMLAAARKNQSLLVAGGVDAPLLPITEITYASNAVSTTLPLAGSQIATAFTYEQLHAGGVGAGTAAWSLGVSGVASTVTFNAILAGGALASGNIWGVVAGVIAAASTVVPVAACWAAARNPKTCSQLIAGLAYIIRLSQRLIRRPAGDAAKTAEQIIKEIGKMRLGAKSWAWLLLIATWNWVADILCLAIVIHAVGSPVPWRGLILVYGAGAATGSLGITPGGIGVVEVALSGALIRAGLPRNEAVASALVYRIISFGLVAAAGWVIYFLLHRRSKARVIDAH